MVKWNRPTIAIH